MSSAASNRALQGLARAIEPLVNPIDLFSGARLGTAPYADNIIIFKRTTTAMLKPHGMTHNYHHRFEWIVPLATAGRIHVDGVGYVLRPGTTQLLFPHQFHHYLDIREGNMNWLFITFECRNAHLLEPLRNSPRIFKPEDARSLSHLMRRQLAAESGAAGRNFELVFEVSRLLQRLLAARKADCAIVPALEVDRRGAILSVINSYVRANLSRPISLSNLARHTGYSVSHLRAVFHREYGVSLGAYMRDSRLSMAAAMLSGGNNRSVAAVAKACGFDSPLVFSRAFKRATGRSPRAYRKFTAV